MLKLCNRSAAVFNSAVSSTISNKKFMGYCEEEEIVKDGNTYRTPYGVLTIHNEKKINRIEFRRHRGGKLYEFDNMVQLEKFISSVLKGEVW